MDDYELMRGILLGSISGLVIGLLLCWVLP